MEDDRQKKEDNLIVFVLKLWMTTSKKVKKGPPNKNGSRLQTN
jgi:hypothetical protein